MSTIPFMIHHKLFSGMCVCHLNTSCSTKSSTNQSFKTSINVKISISWKHPSNNISSKIQCIRSINLIKKGFFSKYINCITVKVTYSVLNPFVPFYETNKTSQRTAAQNIFLHLVMALG